MSCLVANYAVKIVFQQEIITNKEKRYFQLKLAFISGKYHANVTAASISIDLYDKIATTLLVISKPVKIDHVAIINNEAKKKVHSIDISYLSHSTKR